MAKAFTLRLDGIDYDVEVNGNSFIVNGRPFVVGFTDEGRITVDGISYEIHLEGDRAVVDGIAHDVRVSGLNSGRNNNTTGPAQALPRASAAGAGAIQAIMPGTIVRVFASEGDVVDVGDVIVVLEAMKMENELAAPISGLVKAIYVKPGQAVDTNALLAVIDPVD
jgi:biotin carboxyl carrier protein